MKKVTVVLALATVIIIMAVNYQNTIDVIMTYGEGYMFGSILATFLLALLFFWFLENVYFKIKPKKAKV